MSDLHSIIKKAVTAPEDDVRVDISYDIIRHVSVQLYTNPRKAIEELVCNGYDAGATECYVKLPQSDTDALVVLDNGTSMDLQGLKELWMVAKSPKRPNAEGRRIANNRLQIGKFGVGKLAAYALGKRLTHVATINGVTRVVTVDEDEIKERKGGGAPRFNVYKLKESEARVHLDPFLGNLPRPWDERWASWTMAVVEDVGKGNFVRALKLGILRRMITNALPISDDFKVVLEGQTVPLRQIPEIEITVDITDAHFRKNLELNLRDHWKEVREFKKPEDVSPELYKVSVVKIPSPGDVSKKESAIDVPELGPVAGSAILTKETLTPPTLDERGYVNHGFAVYANGKLVNPEEELFGVSPRSHAYWRRFLARVEMPGLDEVLLVQRNAVSENQPKAQVAREVLRTLFEYTRSLADAAVEAEEFPPEPFGSKVGKISPLLTPVAIEGLGGGKLPEGGVSAVSIDFVTLAENSSAAQYDIKEHSIQVNVEHPIIAALDDLKEQNQKQWRRVMGEIVAGGKLAEGFLTARGVKDQIVCDVEELLDASLRSAASYIRDPVEEYIREIDEASYVGGTRFENAVVNAFRSMRLVAWRIGGSDNPDGIVEIPMPGAKNLRIAIEAKGTKGVITHTELSPATVERHEEPFRCTSSVAIAREYQTDGKAGQASGVLRETKDILPLLTVAGIAKMLRLQQHRQFTYDKVATILTTWKHPNELEAFIEELWRQLPELGAMRLVLQVAHEQMQEHDKDFPDPGMIVADKRVIKKGITKKDIQHILHAIAVTTNMIVIKDQDNYEFSMNAPVDAILDAMTRASREEVAEKPTAAKPDSKSAAHKK